MITRAELENVIKKSNSKRDYHMVSKKMILDSFDFLGENVVSITNNSLETGAFPSRWKETIVVPIEKVQNKKKRPVGDNLKSK